MCEAHYDNALAELVPAISRSVKQALAAMTAMPIEIAPEPHLEARANQLSYLFQTRFSLNLKHVKIGMSTTSAKEIISSGCR
jgi:hypothetical protein